MRTSTKLFFLTTLGAVLAGLCSGCASYSHRRPILLIDNKGQQEIGIEPTSFRSFFMLGKASKLRSATKDGVYSRTISVGELQGQGDAETLQKLFEGIGTAAGVAAKTAVKP
jgi:hypothetical protein